MHAKVCVVDDTWLAVGSDNLNRRSWTHDSEICCAVIDEDGDLARDTRLRLAREHLADTDVADDALAEPAKWFDALKIVGDRARRLVREWRSRPSAPGHLREHPRDHVPRWSLPLLHFLHAWILDPDGRPRELRRRNRY